LAVVHPHDAFTPVMIISFVQTLVRLNTKGATASPGEALYCFVSASKTSQGVVTVSGATCATVYGRGINGRGAGLCAGEKGWAAMFRQSKIEPAQKMERVSARIIVNGISDARRAQRIFNNLRFWFDLREGTPD
jgi:hypothetical protein